MVHLQSGINSHCTYKKQSLVWSKVMVASALFGMSFAAVISLASIVLVDMFGLESLTASIGLLVLVKAT